MVTLDATALFSSARALRLRARGHLYRADQACRRALALHEQSWAKRELVRLHLVECMETRARAHSARLLRAAQG